jgi:hypothetical protein
MVGEQKGSSGSKKALRHDQSSETRRISITVRFLSGSATTRSLPESMTVAGLQHRVSKLAMPPRGTFLVRGSSDVAKPIETLKTHSKGKSELTVVVIPKNEEACEVGKHERTCIPSVIITQSPVFDVILDLLKQNIGEAKKLLDWLPTVPSVDLKIWEIAKKKSFDSSQVLPTDAPTVFQYIFEALLIDFDDDLRTHLKRTGGFDYLLRNLSDVLAPFVIRFINAAFALPLKLEFGQLVLDSLYPLLRKTESESTFNLVITFIRTIADADGASLVLPPDEQDPVAAFLLSPHAHVRAQAALLFSRVDIPLSVFLAALPALTKSCEVDFFVALPRHVREYNEDLLNAELQSTSFLSVLERLLEFAPASVKDNVILQLIPAFLEVNDLPRDVATFSQAVKCFSHLQNDLLLTHLSALHEGRSHCLTCSIDHFHDQLERFSKHRGKVLSRLHAEAILRGRASAQPHSRGLRPLPLHDRAPQHLRASAALEGPLDLASAALVGQWTDWNDSPMNPRVRQDAFDFTLMLISKLENALDKTYVEHLFSGTSRASASSFRSRTATALARRSRSSTRRSS